MFFIVNRATIISICDMDFKLYPLDVQNCELKIESCKFFLIWNGDLPKSMIPRMKK